MLFEILSHFLVFNDQEQSTQGCV